MPQFFQDAFDFAAIGMALVAPDGRWLRVNRSLCQIVGYSERELLALTFQQITHPDDLGADLTLMNRLLAAEIPSYQMEKRYIGKDGRLVWISLNVSLVREESGAPKFFISQIQDITGRKLAEHELDVFFSLPLLFRAVFASNGLFRRASPQWLEGMGYSKEELLVRSAADLAHPDDRSMVESAFRTLAAYPSPQSFQCRVRRADGAYRWLLWTARGVPDRGLCFSAAADITPLKEAEERAVADGKEKQRLIDDLTQAVSTIHELRKELVTICAWTKQIRHGDDWHSIEKFLSERLGLTLTHGMSEQAAAQMLLGLENSAGKPSFRPPAPSVNPAADGQAR